MNMPITHDRGVMSPSARVSRPLTEEAAAVRFGEDLKRALADVEGNSPQHEAAGLVADEYDAMTEHAIARIDKMLANADAQHEAFKTKWTKVKDCFRVLAKQASREAQDLGAIYADAERSASAFVANIEAKLGRR